MSYGIKIRSGEDRKGCIYTWIILRGSEEMNILKHAQGINSMCMIWSELGNGMHKISLLIHKKIPKTLRSPLARDELIFLPVVYTWERASRVWAHTFHWMSTDLS